MFWRYVFAQEVVEKPSQPAWPPLASTLFSLSVWKSVAVTWLALALLAQPPALPAVEVVLEVGQTTTLALGYRPIVTVCDDLSIIEVEPDVGIVRLTGLRPGATQCSFRKIGSIPGPPVSIRVVDSRD